MRETAEGWFLNVAAGPQVPLRDRKTAVMHACRDAAPIGELAKTADPPHGWGRFPQFTAPLRRAVVAAQARALH